MNDCYYVTSSDHEILCNRLGNLTALMADPDIPFRGGDM